MNCAQTTNAIQTRRLGPKASNQSDGSQSRLQLRAGSLSSAASSSGCSSVESSRDSGSESTAGNPNKNPSERLTISTKSSNSSSTDDYLEVNELLYLEASSKTGPKQQLELSSGEEPAKLADKEMSQFSAYTLKRSIRQARLGQSTSGGSRESSCCKTLHQPSRPAQLLTPKGSSGGRTYCVHCHCCCCPAASLDPSRVIRVASNSSWQRATMRPRTRQVSGQVAGRREFVARPERVQRSATVAPLRSHRVQQRRSLPVPPPVVPLLSDAEMLHSAQSSASFADLSSQLMNHADNRRRLYGDNWRQHSNSFEKQPNRLRSSISCQSISTSNKLDDAQGSPNSHQSSSMLAKRSSKLLEKLSLGLFSKPASTSASLSTRSPPEEKLGKRRRDTSAESISDICLSAPVRGQDRHADIYDTPEHDARGGADPSAHKTVHRTVGVTTRPCVPPPPVPCPRPGEQSSQRDCVHDARANKLRADSECALEQVSSQLYDVSFDSISQADDRIDSDDQEQSFEAPEANKLSTGEREEQDDRQEKEKLKSPRYSSSSRVKARRVKTVKWDDQGTAARKSSLWSSGGDLRAEKVQLASSKQPLGSIRLESPERSHGKLRSQLEKVIKGIQQLKLSEQLHVVAMGSVQSSGSEQHQQQQTVDKQLAEENKHKGWPKSCKAQHADDINNNNNIKLDVTGRGKSRREPIKSLSSMKNKILSQVKSSCEDKSPKCRPPLSASASSNASQADKVKVSVGVSIGAKANNNNNNNCRYSRQENPLERRKDIIESGDVFIYPPIYKHLNECQRCSRDNKICDCNQVVDSQQMMQTKPTTGKSQSAKMMMSSSDENKEQQVKTVYKISIATASIDQRNNQLRLNTPKIIIPSSSLAASEASKSASANHQLQPAPSCSPSKELIKLVDSTSDERTKCARNDNQKILIAGTGEKVVSEQPEQLLARSVLIVSPLSEEPDKKLCCSSELPEDFQAASEAKLTAIAIGSPDESCIQPCLPVPLLSAANGKLVSVSDCDQQQQQRLGELVEPHLRRQRARRQLNMDMLEEECDQDQQLTCNLTLGDSIKITSASIRIKGQSEMLSHTSIVPISTRRRNVAKVDELVAPTAILENLVSATDSTVDASNDQLEYSPILSTVRDYINNVNTELQVKTSSTPSPVAALSPGPILELSQLLDTDKLDDGSASTLVDSSQPLSIATNAETLVNPIELESPKKSIFDGASRDEILEYLEDARERVPGILMAADEVMMISDNELIVVNQLEPNSPATPISIVEADEVISDESKLQLEVCSDNQTHPDQLRQHLQQMMPFRPSDDTQLLVTSSDAGLVADSQSSSSSSQKESQVDSGEISDLISGENLSKAESETREIIASFRCRSNTIDQQPSANRVEMLANHKRLITRSSIKSTLSNTSQTNSDTNSSGVMDFNRSDFYRIRRNSSSSGRMSRNSTIQMMLQQRYSNRDSLSSSSSSPPSSASPSSGSSSSNQTSGNCSSASVFYASSSLSCSSPLLPISRTALDSPATLNKLSPDNQSKFIVEPIKGQLFESIMCKDMKHLLDQSNYSELGQELAKSMHVERNDSGLGSDCKLPPTPTILETPKQVELEQIKDATSVSQLEQSNNKLDSQLALLSIGPQKLSVIEETNNNNNNKSAMSKLDSKQKPANYVHKTTNCSIPGVRFQQESHKFLSSANLMSRWVHGHYATMNRLNHYFMNRHPLGDSSESTVEFQCLDCDQFIDVDHATIFHTTTQLRLIRDSTNDLMNVDDSSQVKALTADELDRAYIAALNGLPLCKSCEKKRRERKEIISEFVETELKYGRDLKIIHDEFYRPMQVAGLLSKEQIHGVFLNLEELIMAHCRFADKLEKAISEAHTMGDSDYNTVNIGRLFIESAEMLHTFECYCIRQGSAACSLARLVKEKELLRIFLRVSQMENTLLRRMNLVAFLMVPVQRVTKYPLLLNRLYKVTAYHHKDREMLRDAQLKVELHLEHINQQTKGVGATNKIWRRISNLSAPISHRRGLINAEDIGYIKLRKTAMDMLKWDRDETRFIHSGWLNFAPLNEFLIKQKAKPLRYMAAHALLIVLGKPNWKYRPDLVKSHMDSKLLTPTPGGEGIKETALLLFREKSGRFIACHEPLFLSNCVLSNDCSQFNLECPLIQPAKSAPQSVAANQKQARKAVSDEASVESEISLSGCASSRLNLRDSSDRNSLESNKNSINGDSLSMSSMKSLPEEENANNCKPLPPVHTSRSYSLASALPKTTITTSNSSNLNKSTSTTSSNLTILNQLMTKVNSYHNKPASNSQNGKLAAPSEHNRSSIMSSISVGPIVDANNNSLGLAKTQQAVSSAPSSATTPSDALKSASNSRRGSGQAAVNTCTNQPGEQQQQHHQHYNHHFFHNHHQPYGDYEESFEIHDRLSKESMLLRADTPLKTRYWLQLLRYHAKDLGQWRLRRNGLANIMMMSSHQHKQQE